MKKIFALVKRNCLLFLRNKQVVFFSLFSALILIVLYFLFIAKLYVQGFNQAAGLNFTKKQLNAAVYLQMTMGVLVINSVSLCTGAFTFMANDLERRKTDSLLMTSVKPSGLVTAYLLSAIAVSYALNFVTFLLSFIIVGAATGVWLSAGAFFAVAGALVIVTLISCAVMLFITVMVRSSAAIGVINGILGTVLGFLCGIYMPYSNMGKGAEYVGSVLPFTHLSVWLKQIALSDVFGQFGAPESASAMYEQWFSAGNVGLFGASVPLWAMLIISGAVAAALMVVAVFKFKNNLFKHPKRKTKADKRG